MNGLKIVSLSDLIEKIGEDKTQVVLSDFSCPLNKDVETFLREKSIVFAKNSFFGKTGTLNGQAGRALDAVLTIRLQK